MNACSLAGAPELEQQALRGRLGFWTTEDICPGCTENADDADCNDPLVFDGKLLHNPHVRNNGIQLSR
jgi:hypothetical protein